LVVFSHGHRARHLSLTVLPFLSMLPGASNEYVVCEHDPCSA
jgi:hypothetical protein